MLNKEFCFIHNLKRLLWREKENHSTILLVLYTSMYYISLNACSLGFALFTLSLHYIYIYTLEAQRSFARVCSIHNLSPSSSDLNKTALASLSPPSQLVKEPSGS